MAPPDITPDEILRLFDADDCIRSSIFHNDRLRNDNANCLTPEFLADLEKLIPFKWAVEEMQQTPPKDMRYHNIVVTGELPEHEAIFRRWWAKWFPDAKLGAFVTVPWDDSLETREASYRNYVMRKTDMLAHMIVSALTGGYTAHVMVFEDDVNVLAGLDRIFNPHGGPGDWVSLHLVKTVCQVYMRVARGND